MTRKGVITAFKQAFIRFLKRRYIKLFFSFCGLILLKAFVVKQSAGYK